jgi:quercetin dioxygenase-like cupin family protein
VEIEGKKNEAEGLVAGVNRLVDLVAYQRGSVVSRTLLDKKAGTVTLFSFDEGQGLSEHTAPFDALVYLLDGEAEILISGKLLHLREGEMTIMPANQPHALKAVKGFSHDTFLIRQVSHHSFIKSRHCSQQNYDY